MKNYTFTFTEDQINAIAGALAELPYKSAKPLFDTIISQFQAQTTPQEVVPESEPEVNTESE